MSASVAIPLPGGTGRGGPVGVLATKAATTVVSEIGTMAELRAWFLRQLGTDTSVVTQEMVDAAMELQFSDVLTSQLRRLALNHLLLQTVKGRRSRLHNAPRGMVVGVENLLTGEVKPLLLRMQIQTASGTSLISALYASAADWEAQRERHVGARDGHERKVIACTKVVKLLRDAKATCIARCPKTMQGRIEDILLEGWQEEKKEK